MKKAIILYIVFGLILLYFFRYHINPAGVSYISIAEKYASGNFEGAVNGYWGPLLSWLAVPLIVLGIEPLFGVRIVLLTFGLLSLIGINLLFRNFSLSESQRKLGILLAVPIFLYFSFSPIFPDILLTTFFIYYLYLLLSKKYLDGFRGGIFVGILGGLSYLSKAMAFPFFLFHFTLFALPSLSKDRLVVRNFFLGILTFLIISGLWIFILSSKYQKITISTAGIYNFSLIGPGSKGDPIFYKGLFPPPNPTAVSAWEDPPFYKFERWSPFSSKENFVHLVKMLEINVWEILKIFLVFSIFVPALLYLSISKLVKTKLNWGILWLLITPAPLLLGYSVFIVDERYFWLGYVSFFLIALITLEKLKTKKILGSLILLSFLLKPFLFFYDNISSYLRNDLESPRAIFETSQILKNEYGVKGNIASNQRWAESLYISYFLKARYFGRPEEDKDEEELARDLTEKNIDYYFFWEHEFPTKPKFLKVENDITKGKVPNLKVYKLEDKI